MGKVDTIKILLVKSMFEDLAEENEIIILFASVSIEVWLQMIANEEHIT